MSSYTGGVIAGEEKLSYILRYEQYYIKRKTNVYWNAGIWKERNKKAGKHILKWKKAAKWIDVVGIVLVFVAGGVCFVTSDIGNPIKNVAKGGQQKIEKEKSAMNQEGKERKVQNGIETGNSFTVNADVTGDGIEDEIRMNITEEVIEPYTKYEENVVEVISGATGKVVYTMGNLSDINLVHSGYNSLYLYHGEGKDYLLNWNPMMYQGIASYQYEIFTVNESGQKEVFEKDKFSFDLNHMKKSQIEKYKDFIEKVNKRLVNSDVLISTLNGNLVTYNDLPDHLLLFDASEDLDTMNGEQ